MIGIYKDRLGIDGRLTDKQIMTALSWKVLQSTSIRKADSYYLGKNETVLHSEHQNKIPVPYGRKLIKTVLGFMFKEGCITYSFPDSINEDFRSSIEDIFRCNDEETENIRIAGDQAKYGVGYEILYVDNDDAHPQFYSVPARQVTVIYDTSTKPKKIAALNRYRFRKTDYLEIYYSDIIQYCEIRGRKINVISEVPHFFGSVPVIEFRNNREGMGDIESVEALIDAHDEILSTGIDEDDKYADALLLLQNISLDDETVEKLKQLRIIEMDEDGKASYLTKPTTYEGREVLRKVIDGLIYSMSGIPNLDDKDAMAQQSGEALKYLYAAFEMVVAGEKQSGFNDGLMERLRMLTSFQNWLRNENNSIDGISIKWTRNLPNESTAILDNAQKLDGIISRRSMLELAQKAGYIDSVDEEEARLREEAENEPGMTDTGDLEAYGI